MHVGGNFGCICGSGGNFDNLVLANFLVTLELIIKLTITMQTKKLSKSPSLVTTEIPTEIATNVHARTYDKLAFS